MDRNVDQEYVEKEQFVLETYWNKIKMMNPDVLIPVNNGKYVHPDFSGLLQYLGEKEVAAKGYMLGVDANGDLSPDSMQRIDAAIEIILEDLYKTKEQRFEGRQYRVLMGNEETFEEYNYIVSIIAERYSMYVEICEENGITPLPIYERSVKEQKL